MNSPLTTAVASHSGACLETENKPDNSGVKRIAVLIDGSTVPKYADDRHKPRVRVLTDCFGDLQPVVYLSVSLGEYIPAAERVATSVFQVGENHSKETQHHQCDDQVLLQHDRFRQSIH